MRCSLCGKEVPAGTWLSSDGREPLCPNCLKLEESDLPAPGTLMAPPEPGTGYLNRT